MFASFFCATQRKTWHVLFFEWFNPNLPQDRFRFCFLSCIFSFFLWVRGKVKKYKFFNKSWKRSYICFVDYSLKCVNNFWDGNLSSANLNRQRFKNKLLQYLKLLFNPHAYWDSRGITIKKIFSSKKRLYIPRTVIKVSIAHMVWQKMWGINLRQSADNR